MFGGVFREDVAQQCGFRTPVLPERERRTLPGIWLAAAYSGATVTAPGFALHVKEERAGMEASSARKSAVISGELFTQWFGN